MATSDPHAGQHLQNPQVATLVKGKSLQWYAQENYGSGWQQALDTLLQLNPGTSATAPTASTHLIRTSNARWVNN